MKLCVVLTQSPRGRRHPTHLTHLTRQPFSALPDHRSVRLEDDRAEALGLHRYLREREVRLAVARRTRPARWPDRWGGVGIRVWAEGPKVPDSDSGGISTRIGGGLLGCFQEAAYRTRQSETLTEEARTKEQVQSMMVRFGVVMRRARRLCGWVMSVVAVDVY